jgi:hypothetical protein
MMSHIEPDRYANTGFSVKDTSPEINKMIFQRTMALTHSERFLMGMSMLTTAREMIWASLPQDISEPQRRRMFYQRLYGEELPDAVANRVPVLPLQPAVCGGAGA